MNIEEIYEQLKNVIPQTNIKLDEEMKLHTSFKIGGKADIFVIANNISEVRSVLEVAKTDNIPIIVVGNGSNLLVKDNGIRGIVLKINIDTIEIENEIESNKKNEVIVNVGAGVKLGLLGAFLQKKSIEGFEFASGIPGTIGGAVRMNAGAYGGEFKDIVLETTYIDRNGNIKVINNEEHKFSYRRSIFFENNNIILFSKLKLKYGDSNKIKQKMQEYSIARKEKQPLEYPNAGSTFKRGTDFITAKLIDECGLKGYSINDAEVSKKHAGFIINKGNATATDILELVNYIKKEVLEKTNKKIELEIEVIGE